MFNQVKLLGKKDRKMELYGIKMEPQGFRYAFL